MTRKIRLLSTLLAIATLCAAFPLSTAQARPRTFDIGEIGGITPYIPATLQIGDMTFYGVLVSEYANSSELESLIQEALEEAGLTEEEFDKINLNALSNRFSNMSKKEIDDLRDAIVTAGSLIDPIGGVVLNAAKIIDQMNKGDVMDAATTWFDVLTDLTWAIPGNPLVFYKVYKDANEFLNVGRQIWSWGGSAVDSIKIGDFYSSLAHKVNTRTKGLNYPYVLQFTGAADTRTFTFEDVPCEEKWTLTMALKQTKSVWRHMVYDDIGMFSITQKSYFGEYEGDFTIDIEYDLNVMPNILAEELQKSYGEEFIVGTAPPVRVIIDITVTSEGTHSVTRRLTGRAGATIMEPYYNAKGITAYLDVANDWKDVDVSGIVINKRMWYQVPEAFWEYIDNWRYSADAENVLLENLFVRDYGYYYDVRENTWDDWQIVGSWEGYSNIWERGDKLKEKGRDKTYVQLKVMGYDDYKAR